MKLNQSQLKLIKKRFEHKARQTAWYKNNKVRGNELFEKAEELNRKCREVNSNVNKKLTEEARAWMETLAVKQFGAKAAERVVSAFFGWHGVDLNYFVENLSLPKELAAKIRTHIKTEKADDEKVNTLRQEGHDLSYGTDDKLHEAADELVFSLSFVTNATQVDELINAAVAKLK